MMKDYIGRGVYVKFNGHSIELHTETLRGDNTIYLEPEVVEALNRFAERCREAVRQLAAEEDARTALKVNAR